MSKAAIILFRLLLCVSVSVALIWIGFYALGVDPGLPFWRKFVGFLLLATAALALDRVEP